MKILSTLFSIFKIPKLPVYRERRRKLRILNRYGPAIVTGKDIYDKKRKLGIVN